MVQGQCGITVRWTPRDLAFCAYAILSDDALVVEDATTDLASPTIPW